MTSRQLSITDEQAEFFLDNGYLVLQSILDSRELAHICEDMDQLNEKGTRTVITDDPDFVYGQGHISGDPILQSIEFVIDKCDTCKVLLGHPFILRSVEKLMGPDLIPTWDSMVVKLPKEGMEIVWHRDAGTEQVGDKPIFNVDFYLDEADEDTCIWVIPGSNKWSDGEAKEFLKTAGWPQNGAIPVPMNAGDTLFHNILVLHGSPPNESEKMRRVIYYEFRTAHVEEAIGPHVKAYIPLKQKVLQRCLEHRRRANYINEEQRFEYNPPAPYTVKLVEPNDLNGRYRYAHEEYWRH